MLVCSVSLRPRRTVAVEIVETGQAADLPIKAPSIFEVLVDDPASADDRVNMYIGDDVFEAASASDTVSLALAYDADVAEAATAVESVDATGMVFTKWDSATIANVTLSGGDLVATNTGTVNETGARAPSSAGKSSGKYYFEITLTTEAGGGNTGCGVATTASTYTGMGNNATAGGEVFLNGAIYANSANSGLTINNPINGDVIGIAADLDNEKIWFINWTRGGGGT